jgi:aspartyl protease family protein
MNTDDTGRLIYLLILGVAVGGSLLVRSRHELGKTLREGVTWGLIFVAIVAGYGLWGDIRDDISPRQSFIQGSGQIEVPQSPDGHYYLTLSIDGTPVRFVVDTGATAVVLSQRDAARIGIDPTGLAYLGRAQTANGSVKTASVRLTNVELGEIRDATLPAEVNNGAMDGSLLGMTYLNRFETLKITDGKLILTR